MIAADRPSGVRLWLALEQHITVTTAAAAAAAVGHARCVCCACAVVVSPKSEQQGAALGRTSVSAKLYSSRQREKYPKHLAALGSQNEF